MCVIYFWYKTVGNCGKNIARLATNLNNEISRSKELNDYLIKFDVTIRICCTQKGEKNMVRLSIAQDLL